MKPRELNPGRNETPAAPGDALWLAETPAVPPFDAPDDLNELDQIDLDDDCWDVFLADDDERDPEPDAHDFWIDDD